MTVVSTSNAAGHSGQSNWCHSVTATRNGRSREQTHPQYHGWGLVQAVKTLLGLLVA